MVNSQSPTHPPLRGGFCRIRLLMDSSATQRVTHISEALTAALLPGAIRRAYPFMPGLNTKTIYHAFAARMLRLFISILCVYASFLPYASPTAARAHHLPTIPALPRALHLRAHTSFDPWRTGDTPARSRGGPARRAR